MMKERLTEHVAPGRSKAVKSATLQAARSMPRGGGWASSGWASPWVCRAARSRQARPEEAQGASWGTAEAGTLAMLRCHEDAHAHRAQAGQAERTEQRLAHGVEAVGHEHAVAPRTTLHQVNAVNSLLRKADERARRLQLHDNRTPGQAVGPECGAVPAGSTERRLSRQSLGSKPYRCSLLASRAVKEVSPDVVKRSHLVACLAA